MITLALLFLSLMTHPHLSTAAPLSKGSPEQDATGQTSVQDASQPFADANETAGAMLGVYYCTAPFWNALPSVDAACAYSSSNPPSSDGTAAVVSDPCVSLRGTTAQGKPHTWYRNVASFAPDSGVVCTVYDGDACTGASLRIANPGFPDLGVVGWARRVASFACAGSADGDDDGAATAQGGSWFLGD